MRLTIAYSKIKKRKLVLINNDTYQRETLLERPIWQPLTLNDKLPDILLIYDTLSNISATLEFRSPHLKTSKRTSQPDFPFTERLYMEAGILHLRLQFLI